MSASPWLQRPPPRPPPPRPRRLPRTRRPTLRTRWWRLRRSWWTWQLRWGQRLLARRPRRSLLPGAEAEAAALRWLLTGLLVLVLAETVLLVLAAPAARP
jgi:hypothetical protein